MLHRDFTIFREILSNPTLALARREGFASAAAAASSRRRRRGRGGLARLPHSSTSSLTVSVEVKIMTTEEEEEEREAVGITEAKDYASLGRQPYSSVNSEGTSEKVSF